MVPSSWVLWKAFSTVSGSDYHYYYCVNLPDNLIQLAFALILCYIQKLKLRKVKKFARIMQLIRSRAKMQTQVCVAAEPILFPVPPAQITTCLCQFSRDEGPRPVILRWGCCWCFGHATPLQYKHLACVALLPHGNCAPSL